MIFHSMDTKRDRVLIEEGGLMHSHKAPKNEKELRTVGTPRKPGQGKPQNPPKDVGRANPKEER
jgi:hypothetical protein